jgi:hypothetical protein
MEGSKCKNKCWTHSMNVNGIYVNNDICESGKGTEWEWDGCGWGYYEYNIKCVVECGSGFNETKK